MDLLRQAIGLSPLYVPAYAKPGGLGAFPAEGTVEGMQQLAEDKRSAMKLYFVMFYLTDQRQTLAE